MPNLNSGFHPSVLILVLDVGIPPPTLWICSEGGWNEGDRKPAPLLSRGGVPLDLGDGQPLHRNIRAARLRGGAGEVHLPEALRHLLVKRRPEEEPFVTCVGAQLVHHQTLVRVLLAREVVQGHGQLTGIGLPGRRLGRGR